MSRSANKNNGKNTKGEEVVTKCEETEQMEEYPNPESGENQDEEYSESYEDDYGEGGVECEAYDSIGEGDAGQVQQDTDMQKDDYPRGCGEDPTVLMKVYVSTASKSLNSADIKKFLNIKEVKVMEVNQPEWMMCAEMRVCDQEDRDKVLALNGQIVSGYKIKFEVDKEAPDQRTPAVAVVRPGEAYVVKAEGLSAEATVKDFQKLFPTVKEVRLPIAQAGEERVALLDFSTEQEAEKIVSTKQGIMLHKQPLKLEIQKSLVPVSLTSADTTTADDNKKVLFVGNLLYETTEETVKKYFSTCVKVRLLKFGDKQRSKGMGFIHFKTAADALQALIEKKDTQLDGRRILLQFADGERRTAEDYRNKPRRERAKPYSSPHGGHVPGNRWYSRSEVEQGMSFSKEIGSSCSRGRGRGPGFEKRVMGRETSYGEGAMERGISYELEAMGRGRSYGLGAMRRGASYGQGVVGKGMRYGGAMGRDTSFRPGAVGRGSNYVQGAVGRGINYEQGAVGRGTSYGQGAMGRGTSYGYGAMGTGAGYERGLIREGPGYGQEPLDRSSSYRSSRIPGAEFDLGIDFESGVEPGIGARHRAGMIDRHVFPSERLHGSGGLGEEDLDLHEELERTRRLERKLALAMEQKRRKSSQMGMGRSEFGADQYGEFDGRFTENAYSW